MYTLYGDKIMKEEKINIFFQRNLTNMFERKIGNHKAKLSGIYMTDRKSFNEEYGDIMDSMIKVLPDTTQGNFDSNWMKYTMLIETDPSLDECYIYIIKEKNDETVS